MLRTITAKYVIKSSSKWPEHRKQVESRTRKTMLNKTYDQYPSPLNWAKYPSASCLDVYRIKFQKQGYLQFKSRELDIVSKLALIDEFNRLEPAPHFGHGEQRYIRSSAALLFPWKQEPDPLWIREEKKLEAAIHATGAGTTGYATLSAKVKQNAYLNQLIVDDFQLTFDLEKSGLPVYVGVHLMKLSTDNPQRLAMNSPDYFYQDQELFTFVHLVYRSNNLSGGVHYIATAKEKQKRLEEVDQQKILQQFTLQHTTDSFAIYDPTVAHYLTPIQQMEQSLNKDAGEYWMIVIDFSTSPPKT